MPLRCCCDLHGVPRTLLPIIQELETPRINVSLFALSIWTPHDLAVG